MKAKGHQQRQTKRIAAERIAHLFETAERFYAVDPARSDRCVCGGRAIAMRQRLRLGREQRRSFCHALPRLSQVWVERTRPAPGRPRDRDCLVCGNRMRYGTGRHERREPDAGLKPTCWIGKRGITDGMIDEIVRQVKDRKVDQGQVAPPHRGGSPGDRGRDRDRARRGPPGIPSYSGNGGADAAPLEMHKNPPH